MTSISRFILPALAAGALLLAACAPETPGAPPALPIEPHIGYKPPFLPIQFTIDASGIKVSGDASFATPIGTFSVGATLPVVETSSRDILLVLRNRATQTDTVYRIREGQGARIVLNGHVQIDVTSTTVVIEVLEGQVVEISAPQNTPEDQATAAAATAIAQAPPVAGQPRVVHQLELDASIKPEINILTFSHDGTLLAALAETPWGENGYPLYLWRMPGASLALTTASLTNNYGYVQALFSPDDRLLAAVTGDGSVTALNAADGSPAWTLDENLASIAFTLDGQWLVGGCRDCYGTNWLKVWHAADRSLDATREWDGNQFRVSNALSLSADGRWLAMVDTCGTPAMCASQVRIWDLPARQLVQIWDRSGGDIVMSPDGAWLAQRDDYSTVVLRRVPDGAVLRQIDTPSIVRSALALSPDGAYLALADDDGSYVWRTADGQMVLRLREPRGGGTSFAFSPNGLLAIAKEAAVWVWEFNP